MGMGPFCIRFGGDTWPDHGGVTGVVWGPSRRRHSRAALVCHLAATVAHSVEMTS